jgi:hypothetical protein
MRCALAVKVHGHGGGDVTCRAEVVTKFVGEVSRPPGAPQRSAPAVEQLFVGDE